VAKEIAVTKRLVVLVALELAVVALLATRFVEDPAGPGGAAAAASPGVGNRPAAPPSAPASDPAGDPASTPPQSATESPASAPERSAASQRSEVAARWVADDPAGILLTGSVRWSDGTPVDGGTVSASRDGDRRDALLIEGTYAFAGLSPGAWQLFAKSRDRAYAATQVVLTDEAAQTHDIVLEPRYAVRVRIVDREGKDGTAALTRKPIEPDRRTVASVFQVRAWSVAGQRDRFPRVLAPTNSNIVNAGDALWEDARHDGYAGTLQFASGPPAHAALLLRHIVLEQQAVVPGQTEVTFVVDPDAIRRLMGSVRLRVVDAETGAPLPAANVQLSLTDSLRLDEDGRIAVDSVLPGLLTCSVSAPGREHFSRPVYVEPGQCSDLGEVCLGPVAPVTLRVLDAGGAPATRASLTWHELKWRTSAPPGPNRRTVQTDGTCSLDRVGRGPIAVIARAPGNLAAIVVFDNPPAQPVELRLGPAGTCHVSRPADASRSFTVTVLDGRRRAIEAHELPPWRRRATITLPLGAYVCEVHDETGQLLQSGTVQFGEEPATLEIR
jgi:hypothetical protein